MLVMVYYYIDESSLVLALLLALAVTNDYTMDTIVVSTLGLVLLAIIGIYIGSAGSASSADEFSIPSGNLVGMSTTRIDCYEERQEQLRAPRVRFDDDICIHIIDYSEEERTEKLQVIRQIHATLTEKQNIVSLAEDALDKIKPTCNTSIFLHEIIYLHEIQRSDDDNDDDDDDDDNRFEHVEEQEDTSNVYRPNRHIAPKRRKKSKPKRNFKPRRSPRLMGAKCTRSGRSYG
eukprot:scaffold115229_cov38-Attheya_sp.AAC.1